MDVKTQKRLERFTLATSMSFAFGNDVVQNGYPAVLWTASAGPAGIFYMDVENKKASIKLAFHRQGSW